MEKYRMTSVRMIMSQRRDVAGTGARPLNEVGVALQPTAEQRVVVGEVFGGRAGAVAEPRGGVPHDGPALEDVFVVELKRRIQPPDLAEKLRGLDFEPLQEGPLPRIDALPLECRHLLLALGDVPLPGLPLHPHTTAEERAEAV